MTIVQSISNNPLKKVNIEVARIVSGATKLVSLYLLYKEVGWETLDKRREKHKLIQFYKMIKGLTPSYLSNLIPSRHEQNHRYRTRNSSHLVQTPSQISITMTSFHSLLDYGTIFHKTSRTLIPLHCSKKLCCQMVIPFLLSFIQDFGTNRFYMSGYA